MSTRAFVIGLLVGVAIGGGALLLFGSSTGAAPASEPPSAETPTEPDRPPAEALPVLEVRGSADELVGSEAPFRPGEALLRIGDAYVFGDSAAQQFTDGADEDAFDVVCQDIRYGIVLRTPHGALRVAPPFTTSSDPVDPAQVYDRLVDAPPDLTDRNASVPSRPERGTSGVALVRSRDGKTFKVRVLERLGDPRAWKRAIRIAYAEVPVKDGGGRVNLPGEPLSEPLSESSRELLARFESAPKVPSDTFKSFLEGEYQRVTDLPAELDLKDRRYLALPEPLTTKIITNSYSGIVAEQGVAPEGTIVVRSYTGIGIEGDLEGTVDVRSYAYVHVTGDVRGTIKCHSYATVIIDGDVYGTLEVGSYVTLYLKGRFTDPERNLKAGGSCWSTFFFDQHYAAAELERIPATAQITLHVRSSDLEPGKHELAPWREVIVADDLWARLR